MRLRIFTVFALLGFLAAPLSVAWAQATAEKPTTLAKPDRDAIRKVVESQLAAFQRDDGSAAFDIAAPSIQQKLGDAAAFMAMVRAGYPQVYRPKSLAFDRLVDTDAGPDQILRVIGPDGLAYTAHYIMQKQPDGSWRVSGCFLTRGQDQSV